MNLNVEVTQIFQF